LTASSTSSPAAFVLDGVSVVYGHAPALDDISLEIRSGETIAFVGPSGSGKTTLLRLLNGSVRPTRGRVRVGGRALGDMSGAELRRTRASIGFVHQDLRLVPNLQVIQNVVAGRLGTLSLLASIRAMLLTPRRLAHEVHEILDRVGVGEKLYARTDRLSGGQRQRVAIARALFQRPVALIADEPVSSVDPARARDAVQLLADISRQSGLTLCVSLHNLDLAREFFPRLVGLRRGRVVFDKPTSDLQEEQFAVLYHLDSTEIVDDAS
jgi:phosphonate transport system ATP-binding protein